MRKPAFCICENKDADQLRGNREADQRLCFRYTDGTIPLLPKSEISSVQPPSVVVQTGFLRTRLICFCKIIFCFIVVAISDIVHEVEAILHLP